MATSKHRKQPAKKNGTVPAIKRKKSTTARSNEGPPILAEQDSLASEIIKRIRESLSPTKLSLTNLSSLHKKHASSKKHGGGHYSLFVISEVFRGLNIKQRQMWVNNLVGDLFQKSLHALQMDLKEPAEVPLRDDLSVPFKAPRPEVKQSSKKQRS